MIIAKPEVVLHREGHKLDSKFNYRFLKSKIDFFVVVATEINGRKGDAVLRTSEPQIVRKGDCKAGDAVDRSVSPLCPSKI
jgi:hypothetical protein